MPVIGRTASRRATGWSTFFSVATAIGRLSTPSEREQLAQLGNHLVRSPGGDALGHARSEMALEQRSVELVDSALHRVRLFHDVDAVGVIFDHFSDALDVALDRGEAVQ